MVDEHTPLPWTAHTLLIRAGRETVCHLGSSNDFRPPRPHECAANAAFIVKAVNAYPSMVGILSDAAEILPCAIEDREELIGEECEVLRDLLDRIKSALSALDIGEQR